MAWKLMDLQNFAVYFDHELLGSLEGQSLIVSEAGMLYVGTGTLTWVVRRGAGHDIKLPTLHSLPYRKPF